MEVLGRRGWRSSPRSYQGMISTWARPAPRMRAQGRSRRAALSPLLLDEEDGTFVNGEELKGRALAKRAERHGFSRDRKITSRSRNSRARPYRARDVQRGS